MSDTPMQQMTQSDFDAITAIESEDCATPIDPQPLTVGDTMRRMAAVLDRIQTASPDTFMSAPDMYICAQTPEEFQRCARALGTFAKTADDNYFNCTREFDNGARIQVFIARSAVCERVQVGVKHFPEEVIPAKVIPAREEPIYEWRGGAAAQAVTRTTEALP